MVLPSYVAKTPDITLRGSTISRIPKLPQHAVAHGRRGRSRLCSVLLCNPRLVVLGRPNMHKKTPWKTVKMAPIYDFPRAARAEHGHGAKKVLAGVRFQWTDPKKFLRPRWRAGGRSVPYVPRFFCRAPLSILAIFLVRHDAGASHASARDDRICHASPTHAAVDCVRLLRLHLLRPSLL